MKGKIYNFSIDYEYKKSGRETDTLEVFVNEKGRYTVSVLGRGGRVKSTRHDFDDVLSKGWIYDKLTEISSFRWLLAELGVNHYAYAENRYYYA